MKDASVRLFAAVLLIAVATGVSIATPAHAQAQVIKLATLVPEGSVWDKGLRDMGSMWTSSTAGRVTLRVYPGGIGV